MVFQDELLDQLPVLTHLKRWLAEMAVSRPPAAQPSLLLELVPHIRAGLLGRYGGKGGWDRLAREQRGVFLDIEGADIKMHANRSRRQWK